MNESKPNPPAVNRFVVKRTGRKPYTRSIQFVQAIGEQLTPDIWDAIVARAIRDAMFGKSADRTKAREFLSKHLLTDGKENLLDKNKQMPATMGALLTEMFELLRDAFYRNAKADNEMYGAARDALALILVRLSPEERQLFREALAMSETPEAQHWFEEMDRSVSDRIKEFENKGPVRIYIPARNKLP